jgi:CHAD domain-containing protein
MRGKNASIQTDRAAGHSVYDAILRNLGRAPLHSRGDDESVHNARKAMKRMRAGLRLVRAGIGEKAYRRANAKIRDAAKSMTPARDAAAMLRTLGVLRKRCAPQAEACMNPLQKYLEAEHRTTRRLSDKSLRLSASALRRVARQIDKFPTKLSLGVCVQRGIRRIYRQGRTAMRRARREPDNANLHELRKQANYLAHAMELCEPLVLRNGLNLRRRSSKLAVVLGDDHDLAMLLEKIRLLHRRQQLPVPAAAFGAIRQCIKARRRQLQQRASLLGKDLYDRSMRQLKRAISKALAAP